MTDVDTIEQELLQDDATEPPSEQARKAARNAADRARRAGRRSAPRGARAPKAPRASSPRPASKGATAEQVQMLHTSVVAGFMMVSQIFPEHIRPTADEWSNMTEPLERIALRHMPAGEVNPDLADGALFVMAFGGYMIRLGRSGALSRGRGRVTAPTPNTPARPRTAPQQAADMTRQAAAPPSPSDDPLADAFRRTSNASEAEIAAIIGA